MYKPSSSTEDYLKRIYLLQYEQDGVPVSTSSLAKSMGVTNASTTASIKRLASTEPQLVFYEPYTGVTLTDAGQRIALEVIRHHRLIEAFLQQVLGYSWDEVHAEAEVLEHVISERMEDRMDHILGAPRTDPHGDPIPDRDGNFTHPEIIQLTQLDPHLPAIIYRIKSQEPELLRYLADLGICLSAQIEIVSKAPFNGPISFYVEGPSTPVVALGREVTDQIFVTRIGDIIVEEPK